MRQRGPGPNETTLPLAAGLPGPPTAPLLLVAGEGFVSMYELGDRGLVIGRDAECDVRIEHRALSRRHAVVRPGPPLTVQDLGSTNGTLVGGGVRRGGDAVELTASDRFQIGPFSFVLMARAAGEQRSLSGGDVLRIVDPTLRGVSPLVKHIATSPVNVLILGETGVGKEVLATTIHQLSERPGAFTRINCAALSESLLESELFGHEKGAFTGAAAAKIGLLEAADGGTVFLDELGELPPAIQAKLLRAVEHREVLAVGSTRPRPVDVRFIAATNRDLPAEVEAGRFRRDLYFRLDGVTLVIPPLRERRRVIATMAIAFAQEASRKSGGPAQLSADVLAALEAYDWPGNVRELKAVLERARLFARSGELEVRHLAFARRAGVAQRPPTGTERPPAGTERPPTGTERPPTDTVVEPAPDLGFLDEAQRAERARVIEALEACAGNQTRAARQLGIGRTSLIQKLRLYRIPRPRL